MVTKKPSQLDGVDFLSLPSLVRVLNRDVKVVSREHIYRQAQQNAFPVYRVGRKIFVRLEEVLSALRVKG